MSFNETGANFAITSMLNQIKIIMQIFQQKSETRMTASVLKQISGLAFHLIFHRLTVVYVSFCSSIEGITPKFCAGCVLP